MKLRKIIEEIDTKGINQTLTNLEKGIIPVKSATDYIRGLIPKIEQENKEKENLQKQMDAMQKQTQQQQKIRQRGPGTTLQSKKINVSQ